MRILVITDRFTPEVTAVSVRTLAHAREWVKQGNNVTIVTCIPNFPRGKPFVGYKNRLYQEEWIDGIQIVRIWSYMVPNEGTIKRTLDYVSFAISSIILSWKYPAFDVILATSPPIFTAVAAFTIAWLRKRPWVFEIRDLWPASIVAVGASKSPALKAIEKMEMFLYRNATRVISLTNAFKADLMLRGIPASKNDVITNGVDLTQFSNSNGIQDGRNQLGISKDVFLAGYIGTVGMAHGLGVILDAAGQCQNDPKITFLIMGEGAERKNLEAEATRRLLTNIVFRDFVPHDEIGGYIAALDVAIVHLKKDPVFAKVIPSKIFEYMALGVPMIMAVEGESADIVASSKSGICIPSDDPVRMAKCVVELAHDPVRLEQLRSGGLRSVRDSFDRKMLASAVIRSLEVAINDYGKNAKTPYDSPSVKVNSSNSDGYAGEM